MYFLSKFEREKRLWTIEQWEKKFMTTTESVDQKRSRAARSKDTEVLGAASCQGYE